MKGTIGGWLDDIRMLWRYGFTSPMNAQKLYALFFISHALTHRTQTLSHIYRGSRKSKETAVCIFESPPPPNETSNASSPPSVLTQQPSKDRLLYATAHNQARLETTHHSAPQMNHRASGNLSVEL